MIKDYNRKAFDFILPIGASILIGVSGWIVINTLIFSYNKIPKTPNTVSNTVYVLTDVEKDTLYLGVFATAKGCSDAQKQMIEHEALIPGCTKKEIEP